VLLCPGMIMDLLSMKKSHILGGLRTGEWRYNDDDIIRKNLVISKF
jgi:hypothetical protein